MSNTDFKQIKQLITSRRSVFHKNYEKKMIEPELIQELLECADAAPTHKKTQPWRFVVFSGAGKERLADALTNIYDTHTAPDRFLEKSRDAIIQKVMDAEAIIAISIRYSGAVPAWEEVAATGAAVQNIWLAAAAAGIGGYWSSPANLIPHMGPFLQLDEGSECLGLFYMGYHSLPAQEPNRSPLDTKVRWEV